MDVPRPLQRHQDYLPIADHGLIGDGKSCALIGRDGAVAFMCVPRFDSAPLFAALLDRERGGTLLLAPVETRCSRQWYEPGTGVLVTEMTGPEGTVEVTDAFLLKPGARLEEDVPAGTGRLLRRARVTRGRVTLHVNVAARPPVSARWGPHGWELPCPHQKVTVRIGATHPLPAVDTTVRLREGETFTLCLDWSGGPARAQEAADQGIDATVRAWRRWAGQVPSDLPRPQLVLRSAITLKLLDHIENGAILAAPTASLPECIGGTRNWDYRYAWIRDAAYAVFALRRIGLPSEAEGFLHWVLEAVGRGPRPLVLYDIDGLPPPGEVIDTSLEGYRRSAPVRWGNAAADQVQHDLYGEILDCAFQWAATGGRLPERLWHQLTGLVQAARTAWQRPDHGIWEVRTPGRPFTYSAAMCQVALDRAARLARRLNLPGDAAGWAADAHALTDRIVTEAWNDEVGALASQMGGRGGLDASLLALPLRRVLPADHPRMAATAQIIGERLDAGGGLLFRYLPRATPDGIDEPEGAFVLCSFWMADNLAGQGRTDEAGALFERLCSYASPLGLLPEQIDPSDGSFVGNFPQGLSHVGLLSSAVVLARTQRGIQPELSTQAWFRH
ncbi:glycoside hydrolase family 15 protein [Streptomyces sp. F8]|uniref:glycoside hydrolase family 15 protein n=1 Tax=Streptomyces sp. F8 TaxID=1436085 RepID=UPI0029D29B98|nr:glycoside hydrolase family 15 protein [Streptomyces sp. F8]MDX6760126.1 glycoside hydrolase family 15 protein [Streptomyces sp. F8]